MSLANLIGKAKAALAVITDDSTDADKTYMEDNVHQYLVDITSTLQTERRNVRDYGDANTASIQAAIDSLSSGGEILLPQDTYAILNSTINPDSSNKIIGNGIGATKLDYSKTSGSSGTGVPVIEATSKNDITISDLEIDGNAANNGFMGEFDAGINLVNCNRVLIENLHIHDLSGDGITLRNCDDVIIRNCIIDVQNVNVSGPQVGRNPIAIIEGSRIIIDNCILTGGLPAAIDIEPNSALTVEKVIISNCIINSSDDMGISINSSASTSVVNHIDILNCQIHDSAQEGIRLIGNPTNITIKSCKIQGSVHASEGQGLDIGTASGIKVSDCDIYDCTATGIILGSGTVNALISACRVFSNGIHGINVAATSGSEAKYIKISDCIIYNNANNGIDLNFCDNFILSGNMIFDDQGTPTQDFAIDVDNSDGGVLIGNMGDNNVSGEFNVNTSNNSGIVFGHNWNSSTIENAPLHGGRAALGQDFIFRMNSGQGFIVEQPGGTNIFSVDNDSSITTIGGEADINGAFNHDGSTFGAYGAAPVSQQTGVAVSAAAVHAALVNLGFITA